MKTKQSSGFFWQQNYLSWILYGLGTLLFALFQMAPHLFPAIAEARPSPLLPFVICVAMFEGPRIGAIIGTFAGLIWGMYAFRLYGLDALILLVLCVVAGLLVQWILRTNFWSGMLLCTGAVLIHTVLEWSLCYALFMHDEMWTILYKVYLPNALYTIALAPAVYYLVLLMAQFIRKRSKS